MTNDLVKCLRARVNGGMHWVTVERMAAEAADRIEQLEAALRRLAETDLTGVALAALGEKKDD